MKSLFSIYSALRQFSNRLAFANVCRFCIIGFILVGSGCVQVNFPQVNALHQVIVPKTDPLDAHRWNLTVGNYTTQVYLIYIDEQPAFVNGNLDVLVMQDRSIVSARLPHFTDAQIDVVDELNDEQNIIRRLRVNNTLFESQECGAWKSFSNVRDNKKDSIDINAFLTSHITEQYTRQEILHCAGTVLQTQILIYNNDELLYLSQYLPYIDKQIRLTKVSKR